MDLEARQAEYHAWANQHFHDCLALRSIWRGKPDMLAKVQEYRDLAEDLQASLYDLDRCTQRMAMQDESKRGKAAKAEYQSYVERCQKRVTEIAPKVAQLKEELGA